MWTKCVFRKEDEGNMVLDFKPSKFPQKISKSASSFVERERTESSGFKINPLLAEQTGIKQLQTDSLNQQVESLVLEKVKEIQEEAHEQAYQLGLSEGRAKAFKDHEADILERLGSLDKVLTEIQEIKAQLVVMNEAHVVKLVFQIAEKMTMAQIQIQPEIVLDVINKAIATAQSDEQVLVKLSPKDLTFVEGVKDQLGREFEKLKNSKLDRDESIAPGGCIVETNYGMIDATVPERVNKIWESLSEILPKVKPVVKGPNT